MIVLFLIDFTGYFFWLSKFIDMLDTVFFVLRKKTSQVTTLHIVHHGILPITVWPGLRYANGGNTAVCCLVNGGVHVVMYAYYLLSAMGPRVQSFVSKFKKYVTRIQITQFIAMIIHSFLFLIVEDCGFPMICSCWVALNEILFLFLFLDFYKRAYGNKKQDNGSSSSKQQQSSSTTDNNNHNQHSSSGSSTRRMMMISATKSETGKKLL